MAKNAGTLAVALTANSTQFDRTLARTEKRIQNFASFAKTAFASVGVALSATAIIGAGRAMLNTLNNIGKRSDALNISTDRYQMLSYAAERTGTAMGDVEAAIFKTQQTLGKAITGDLDAVRAFSALGLSVDKLKGLAPDQLFDRVAVAVADIADESERATAAQGVMGRGFNNIKNFLRDYLELGMTASEMGLIVAEKEVRAAEKINDALTDVNRKLVTMIANLGIISKLAYKLEDVFSGRWGERVLGDVVDAFLSSSFIDEHSIFGYKLWDAKSIGDMLFPSKAGSQNWAKTLGLPFGKIDWDAQLEKDAQETKKRLTQRLQEEGLTAEKVVDRDLRSAELARRRAELAAKLAASGKNAEKQTKEKVEKAEKDPDAKIAGSFSLRDLAMTVTQNAPAERTAKATEKMVDGQEYQTEIQKRLTTIVEAGLGVAAPTYQ